MSAIGVTTVTTTNSGAERVFGYPVWVTQGGGLVREIAEKYYFVEKPDCPGLDVGDEMPGEWGVFPANDLAREEVAKNDEGAFLESAEW